MVAEKGKCSHILLWVRVLKSSRLLAFPDFSVALFVSACIETVDKPRNNYLMTVALLMGACVEISSSICSIIVPLVAFFLNACVEIITMTPL